MHMYVYLLYISIIFMYLLVFTKPQDRDNLVRVRMPFFAQLRHDILRARDQSFLVRVGVGCAFACGKT